MAATSRSEQGTHRAVIFADLAGFTALTEAHGDDNAADLVQQFAHDITLELPKGAHLVKVIGDAAMLVANDAVAGTRLAEALIGISENLPGRPALRVGIHAGDVVARDGDYWGHTVNVAARVASLARPNEILLTATVREEIAKADAELDSKLALAGEHELRNVAQPLVLYSLMMDEGKFHTDPVCRMRLREGESVARLNVGDRTHYFCSTKCVRSFLDSSDSAS